MKKIGIRVATISTKAELPTSYRIQFRSKLVRRNLPLFSIRCSSQFSPNVC